MMMEFSNTEHGKMSLDKGRSFLMHLSEANIEKSIELYSSDGAVDGAMYLIYRGLVESGDIESVQVNPDSEPCEKIVTTTHLLKYIMYNCFIMGAEAAKSVNELDVLWNREESKEPEKE